MSSKLRKIGKPDKNDTILQGLSSPDLVQLHVQVTAEIKRRISVAEEKKEQETGCSERDVLCNSTTPSKVLCAECKKQFTCKSSAYIDNTQHALYKVMNPTSKLTVV